MNRPQFPVLVSAPVIRASNTVFHLPTERLEVGLPRALVHALIERCDGQRSLRAIGADIRARFGVEVEDVLRDLLDAGVLVDANDAGRSLWHYVEAGNVNGPTESEVAALTDDESLQAPEGTPTHVLSVPPSPWRDQLASRESTRTFTPAVLTETDLSAFVWSAYGAVPGKTESPRRRTSPSGGALYPLVLHVVLFEPAGSVTPGVYRVTSRRPFEVELTFQGAPPPVEALVFDPRSALGANGFVAISGSFARGRPKYGSRSLLLTLVEAGHAAQNLHLAAVDGGLATLEVVAHADALRAHLGLEVDWTPFVVVLFGAASNEVRPSGPMHVESLPRRVGTFKLPNVFVVAQDESGRSMGMARTKDIATLKARAESVERMAFREARRCPLVLGSLVELGERAIDPRQLIAYAPEQLDGHRYLRPFDPGVRHEWFEVKSHPGDESRLVLADFICPQKSAGGYVSCSSSGAAAHTSRDRAVEGGLLELVERDAFMVTWLNRLQHPRIRASTLPASLRRRVSAIEAEGYAVHVVDMTLDLSPVMLLVMIHPEAPLLACAAAADFSREAALQHALGEAENLVYWHLQGSLEAPILAPEEVETVAHHASLYREATNIRRARFLARGREITFRQAERRPAASSLEALEGVLEAEGREVLVADLRRGNPGVESTPFEVVKVLVPGLVPISFGWNNEPLGMPRMGEVRRSRGLRGSRELNRFPHPFA